MTTKDNFGSDGRKVGIWIQREMVLWMLLVWYALFFVVAIHTNLGIENELTWILFQTIARIAVPYFLVVAGWFFYRNILINQRVIFKYIMNLLRAYVIASLPFAVVFIIKNNKSETFFRKLLVALLWKGMATHLWCFPATIFALVVCWLIIRITGSVIGKALVYLGWGTNLICSVCDIYSHAFGFECGGVHEHIATSPIRYLLYSDRKRIIGFVFNQKRQYSNVIVFMCAILLVLEKYITFKLGLNTTVTMALMYVPTVIVVCTNILNEKWIGNISALSLNFKKASAFTYYYHPILISVFSKFVNNSYILFAIVSFVMFAINCIFQKSGSKFYKTITK